VPHLAPREQILGQLVCVALRLLDEEDEVLVHGLLADLVKVRLLFECHNLVDLEPKFSHVSRNAARQTPQGLHVALCSLELFLLPILKMTLNGLADFLRIGEVALVLLLEVVCEPGLCKGERERKGELELVIKVCTTCAVEGAPRTISLST
jgi:hypothetical protein